MWPHHWDKGGKKKKSAYSRTTSAIERDHPSTVAALFKVSSLQSRGCWQTVDSSLIFPALRSSMWSPFHSLFIYVTCYFKPQSPPITYSILYTLATRQYGQFWHKLVPRWCRGERLSQRRSDTGVNTTGSVHRWESSDASRPYLTHVSNTRLLVDGSVSSYISTIIQIITISVPVLIPGTQWFKYTCFSQQSSVGVQCSDCFVIFGSC